MTDVLPPEYSATLKCPLTDGASDRSGNWHLMHHHSTVCIFWPVGSDGDDAEDGLRLST
jgi:hypothetical protein